MNHQKSTPAEPMASKLMEGKKISLPLCITLTKPPQGILRKRFGEFIRKCEKYREDLLKENSTELCKEILSGLFDTPKFKKSLDAYSNWMQQSWVRELILSTLTQYKDNYAGVEIYEPAWSCENTYRLYKLFCILIPVHIYDDENVIVSYAKFKKILPDRLTQKYIHRHWKCLIELFEKGKFIFTDSLKLYKLDFGSIKEYVLRTQAGQKARDSTIDITKEKKKQIPVSNSKTSSAVPDSTTSKPKAAGCRRRSTATTLSSSEISKTPSPSKKLCPSTADLTVRDSQELATATEETPTTTTLSSSSPSADLSTHTFVDLTEESEELATTEEKLTLPSHPVKYLNDAQDNVATINELSADGASVKNTTGEFLNVMAAVKHLPIKTQNIVALYFIEERRPTRGKETKKSLAYLSNLLEE